MGGGSVIVVGGGPAGMMAAAFAAENNKVVLYEKNEKLGKKLYITGKGRCNLTNYCQEEDFLKSVVTNPRFMYSSIYALSPLSLMEYFQRLSVKLTVERGGRVFPASQKASDINKALAKALADNNVEVCLNCGVKEIAAVEGAVKGVYLEKGGFVPADAVVIATGGMSYPATGSTGDGYRFARNLGHNIKDPKPSLVSLLSGDSFLPELMGLSLKNVACKLVSGKKKLYEGFGEMIFTDEGISGPLILTASCYYKEQKETAVIIDLKPALDFTELDSRILRDFREVKNRTFKNGLDDLLPRKLIPVVVKLSGISPEKRVNEVTKEERRRLLEIIKGFRVSIRGTGGFSQAVVTQGGVDVKEIDPCTMESRIVKGLYFVGEVMDVDGLTGGFNLQIAFSTGYVCGKSLR